jgi:hypothetical protein
VAVTDTISSTMTIFYYDATGQRLLNIEPDGTEIYYPFAGYDEEITDTVTILSSCARKCTIYMRPRWPHFDTSSAAPTSWPDKLLPPALAVTPTPTKTASSSSTATIWAATAS